MSIKSITAKIKAGGADGLEEGQFLAYASTFTRKPDSYGDVIKKGAFAETIDEWEKSDNVLPVLFGHNMSDPDYNIGAVLEAKEDDHGLLVKGQLDLDSPKGAQVYRLLKGRRVSQLSFAFDVLEDGLVDLGDGDKANELRKLKLYEVSIVPIGANQETEVLAVKTAVAALSDIKAGRVLSAKNEKSLRDARDSLDAVLASLGDTEDGKAGTAGKSQDEASGTAEAKDEAREGKSEEPKLNPSARDLATLMTIELDALSS